MPANSVLLLQIRAEVEKYRENKHTKYNVYKIPVIQKQYFLYRSRGKKEGGHKRGWFGQRRETVVSSNSQKKKLA